MDRDADAREGDEAPAARTRLRELVEFAAGGSSLENTYAYGHSNRLARPASEDLATALQLTNPRALLEPQAHIDRYIPRRREYARAWEEVKASSAA